jgi:ADP-ribose pyrophosphatase YjhB (NUDIX family)
MSMREWFVAGALIERDGELLLVQNRRRNGRVDWSPPGGVIEHHTGEAHHRWLGEGSVRRNGA